MRHKQNNWRNFDQEAFEGAIRDESFPKREKKIVRETLRLEDTGAGNAKFSHNSEKNIRKYILKDRDERKSNGFRCIEKDCKSWVHIEAPGVGTQHRNHCNSCLASRHLDSKTPGDRKADCGGKMTPIAIAVKHRGDDVMIVHKCNRCCAIQPNRIAGDDNLEKLLSLLDKTFEMSVGEMHSLEHLGIQVARQEHRQIILESIIGKGSELP